MSEKTINRVLFLHARQEQLTDWEKDLVADRFEALKKYKTSAVATKKQVYQIGQIYKKLKLTAKIDGA